ARAEKERQEQEKTEQAQREFEKAQSARRQKKIDDAYRTLGLTKNATYDQAKRRYRRLIKENHPDSQRYRSADESSRRQLDQRTRDINAAWSLLQSMLKQQTKPGSTVGNAGAPAPGAD